MNSRIIAFIGTVGAGKSTQMKLMSEHFRSKGFKVKIIYLKVGNLWAYPFYKIASEGWPIFRSKYFFKLWIVLDALAIIFKFLILMWLPFKVGYTIFVEEYLPSVIADYFYIARINGHSLRNFGIIYAIIYKLATLAPFTSVFLDADDATLSIRWKLRGTADEKHRYILMQRGLLLSLTEHLSKNFFYVNTSNRTVIEINQYLEEQLRSY